MINSKQQIDLKFDNSVSVMESFGFCINALKKGSRCKTKYNKVALGNGLCMPCWDYKTR